MIFRGNKKERKKRKYVRIQQQKDDRLQYKEKKDNSHNTKH